MAPESSSPKRQKLPEITVQKSFKSPVKITRPKAIPRQFLGRDLYVAEPNILFIGCPNIRCCITNVISLGQMVSKILHMSSDGVCIQTPVKTI